MLLRVEVDAVQLLHDQRSVFQKLLSQKYTLSRFEPAVADLHAMTCAGANFFWIRVKIHEISFSDGCYWFMGSCADYEIHGAYSESDLSGWFVESK